MQANYGRVQSISSEWLASARAAGAAADAAPPHGTSGSAGQPQGPPAGISSLREAPALSHAHAALGRGLSELQEAGAGALAAHTVATGAHSEAGALPTAALSVAEMSERALSSARRLGAGLIAATVSVGRLQASEHDISVATPEPHGMHVTSSEENSPQLVDVLRQSALHERYHESHAADLFGVGLVERRASEGHMNDVLEDSLELDDSWVTVDESMSECDLDGSHSSLQAARGFLQRHVWHRLRPSLQLRR